VRFITIKEKKHKVISETLITGYVQETNKEMRARQKKGIPLGKYAYVAIKVKG
jgi:hypothetical protein